MRSYFRRFLICVIALLVGSAWAQDVGMEKKGIVTYIDGQVRRQPIDEENWREAPVNTDVLSGDKVRTYRESKAELDFEDLGFIGLAPRTIVDVVKLYQESKEKQIETEIHLAQGEIWATVDEEKETSFDITAPITAAAITGTILRMHVDIDSTTQMKVYQGEVHITNAPKKKAQMKPQSLIPGDTPREVPGPQEVPGPTEVPGPHEVSVEEWLYIVKAMQQVTIDKQGKVVSKGRFTANDRDEQSNWVQWNHTRDLERLRKLRQARRR